MESKRFTIRLGPMIEEIIEKYRGKISKSAWIKKAIIEKAERSSKK